MLKYSAKLESKLIKMSGCTLMLTTDYGRPVRKSPSLHGRKSNLNPKFVGTTEAYFVSHIGPKFQISLIYAFIGCPQSVLGSQSSSSQRRKLESIMSPQKGAF